MLTNCRTAIILAGGKSSRMGFDKINIPFNGGRLLDWQVQELKKLFREIIIVSNELNDYHDEQVRVICDEYKDIGPLAGLHVGLKHARTEYCYVVACDMPFINTDFIVKMDELLTSPLNDQDVLVSTVDGHIEPFNSIYKASTYKKIQEYVTDQHRFGLRKFIKQLNYRIVKQELVDSFGKEMFYNVNTTDDIKKYLKTEVI